MSNDILTDLLLHYPGITATNTKSSGICLKGCLNIKNNWYRIMLHCIKFPQINELCLKVQRNHNVKTLTTDSPGMRPEWSVEEVLESLPLLLNESERIATSPTAQEFYVNTSIVKIFEEISSLYAPESYKIHMNGANTRIRFTNFYAHKEHFFELTLPDLRVCEHSLPNGIPWEELLQKCLSLTAVLQQFQTCLEDLCTFYGTFAAIDELCYVVQPTKVSTKENWRVFLLRERVFLKLIITDPFAPLASMSVHIIGPTYELEGLRGVYSAGLHNWDAELDIHKNLLRIFDLCYFPMAPTASEDNEEFCNICYSYHMEDEVPIVSCDNKHCTMIFHAICLNEWFASLSEGRMFLGVSFGTCPNCKAKLSTSFEEVLKK